MFDQMNQSFPLSKSDSGPLAAAVAPDPDLPRKFEIFKRHYARELLALELKIAAKNETLSDTLNKMKQLAKAHDDTVEKCDYYQAKNRELQQEVDVTNRVSIESQETIKDLMNQLQEKTDILNAKQVEIDGLYQKEGLLASILGPLVSDSESEVLKDRDGVSQISKSLLSSIPARLERMKMEMQNLRHTHRVVEANYVHSQNIIQQKTKLLEQITKEVVLTGKSIVDDEGLLTNYRELRSEKEKLQQNLKRLEDERQSLIDQNIGLGAENVVLRQKVEKMVEMEKTMKRMSKELDKCEHENRDLWKEKYGNNNLNQNSMNGNATVPATNSDHSLKKDRSRSPGLDDALNVKRELEYLKRKQTLISDKFHEISGL